MRNYCTNSLFGDWPHLILIVAGGNIDLSTWFWSQLDSLSPQMQHSWPSIIKNPLCTSAAAAGFYFSVELVLGNTSSSAVLPSLSDNGIEREVRGRGGQGGGGGWGGRGDTSWLHRVHHTDVSATLESRRSSLGGLWTPLRKGDMDPLCFVLNESSRYETWGPPYVPIFSNFWLSLWLWHHRQTYTTASVLIWFISSACLHWRGSGFLCRIALAKRFSAFSAVLCK